jgi:hypothetical protein
VEDRFLELEVKNRNKEKTEEILVKHFKSSERNIQELSNSIKIPNQRIMGIDEEEEVQAKVIHNIFNKIVTENFPKLKKDLPTKVQESPGHQTDLTKIDPHHSILSLKQPVQRTEKEY